MRPQASAAASTGCTVPTSWLALISAASAVPGLGDRRRERVEVDPAEPVHTDLVRGATGGDVPLRRVQHRRVLDRRVHEGAAHAFAAAEPAEHGGVRRGRAAGGERQLVRAHPEHLGGGTAGRVEQLAGPPRSRVEPGRIGPAVVQRGGQCLPGRRVQRRRTGGVEIRF